MDSLEEKKTFTCGTTIHPPTTWQQFASLIEIADIDDLLGFKGNYMIFPLKPNHNNPLINYMMQDYVVIDDILQATDPDDLGNYNTDELIEIMKCMYKKNPDEFTEEVKSKFKELLLKRLTSPNSEKELIIVPTDSLYIDAIPGNHPVLEDYKLIHRAVDVKKAQASVRQDELKNILRAIRILKGEIDEPTVDKRIIVEGKSDIHLDPEN